MYLFDKIVAFLAFICELVGTTPDTVETHRQRHRLRRKTNPVTAAESQLRGLHGP